MPRRSTSTASTSRRMRLERRFQPVQVAASRRSSTRSRSSRGCATATRRTTGPSPTVRWPRRVARRPLHQRPVLAGQGDRPHRRGGDAHACIRRMTAPPDLREVRRSHRRGAQGEGIGDRRLVRTSRRPQPARQGGEAAVAQRRDQRRERVAQRRHGRRGRGRRRADRRGPR